MSLEVQLPEYLPPNSLEAEVAVLGAALISAAAALYVVREVPAEAFYDRFSHVPIWDAIAYLVGRQEPVDSLSVSERMRNQGTLDRIGGMAHINALWESVPTAAHVQYYAAVVLEKWRLRQVIEEGRTLIAAGHEEEETADEIEAGLIQRILARRNRTRQGVTTLRAANANEAQRIRSAERVPAMRMGLPSLDRSAMLENGQVGILLGHPGSGKTALGVQGGCWAGNNHGPGAIISLEMEEGQLVRRRLAGLTRMPYTDLRDLESAGYGWTEEDRENIAEILERRGDTKHEILIDTCSSEMSRLVSAMHSYKLEHGITWAVLDYGQLLTDRRRGYGGGANEMEAIARGLKDDIATPLRIPLWVLVQPSQESAKRGGRLKRGDARGTQEWTAVAAMLWHLDRDEDYPADDETSGMILTVEKNRNGPTFELPLAFHKPSFEFRERDETHDEADAPPERRWS